MDENKRVRIDKIPIILYYVKKEKEDCIWEIAALDRIRFQRRIKETENLLIQV